MLYFHISLQYKIVAKNQSFYYWCRHFIWGAHRGVQTQSYEGTGPCWPHPRELPLIGSITVVLYYIIWLANKSGAVLEGFSIQYRYKKNDPKDEESDVSLIKLTEWWVVVVSCAEVTCCLLSAGSGQSAADPVRLSRGLWGVYLSGAGQPWKPRISCPPGLCLRVCDFIFFT